MTDKNPEFSIEDHKVVQRYIRHIHEAMLADEYNWKPEEELAAYTVVSALQQIDRGIGEIIEFAEVITNSYDK